MIDIGDGIIIPKLRDALYKDVDVNCLFGLASVYLFKRVLVFIR